MIMMNGCTRPCVVNVKMMANSLITRRRHTSTIETTASATNNVVIPAIASVLKLIGTAAGTGVTSIAPQRYSQWRRGGRTELIASAMHY